jgi:hypothetical protein
MKTQVQGAYVSELEAPVAWGRRRLATGARFVLDQAIFNPAKADKRLARFPELGSGRFGDVLSLECITLPVAKEAKP